MSSPLIPEWDELDVPDDDTAEPDYAGVDHLAETNDIVETEAYDGS